MYYKYMGNTAHERIYVLFQIWNVKLRKTPDSPLFLKYNIYTQQIFWLLFDDYF